VYVLVLVVTEEAVPMLQRFVVGTEEKVLPLLEPQEPFVGDGGGGGVTPTNPESPYTTEGRPSIIAPRSGALPLYPSVTPTIGVPVFFRFELTAGVGVYVAVIWVR
jgi:hypothetical protein